MFPFSVFFFFFHLSTQASKRRGKRVESESKQRGSSTYRENDHFDGMRKEESQKKTRMRKRQRSGTGLENRKEEEKKGRDPPERGNLKIII